MSNRPIIFSAPMVRALLEGRKTQTRRILKPPYGTLEYLRDGTWRPICIKFFTGDRLWVREKWQGLSFGDYLPTESRVCDLRFAATDALGDADKDVRGYSWRPSIHMPRWASRLTLTVTNVRVQRLQEISAFDVQAEGACELACIPPTEQDEVEAQEVFSNLWNSLHGPDAWAANPWVVALTFTVHHGNIDKLEAKHV